MNPKVIFYCTSSCPFCKMAENLLLKKGFKVIEKIRIDLFPQMRKKMIEETGKTSVPQIFINNKYVGGFDNLSILEKNGQLESFFE